MSFLLFKSGGISEFAFLFLKSASKSGCFHVSICSETLLWYIFCPIELFVFTSQDNRRKFQGGKQKSLGFVRVVGETKTNFFEEQKKREKEIAALKCSDFFQQQLKSCIFLSSLSKGQFLSPKANSLLCRSLARPKPEGDDGILMFAVIKLASMQKFEMHRNE